MSGAEDLDGDLPERRDPADAIVRVLEIVNKKGLHARASAKFCQTVERFDAAVRVTRAGETVGGTSIMGLMMLGAATGTTITVEATGSEATAAVDALGKAGLQRFWRRGLAVAAIRPIPDLDI
jgi:phosphocarrier protein